MLTSKAGGNDKEPSICFCGKHEPSCLGSTPTALPSVVQGQWCPGSRGRCIGIEVLAGWHDTTWGLDIESLRSLICCVTFLGT